jgi:hypothetical protein
MPKGNKRIYPADFLHLGKIQCPVKKKKKACYSWKKGTFIKLNVNRGTLPKAYNCGSKGSKKLKHNSVWRLHLHRTMTIIIVITVMTTTIIIIIKIAIRKKYNNNNLKNNLNNKDSENNKNNNDSNNK